MMEEDAALARALWAAEQHDNHDDHNDAYHGADSDSDYGGERRQQRKRPRKRARRPRAATPPPPPAAAAAPPEQEATTTNNDQAPDAAAATATTATGRRVRRDKGDARRDRQARAWSEDEEARFCRGLELHGRDWAAVASVVGGGRDGRAVASHAQKHFVRLCARGVALPPKVAESGAGYTLSGRLLDPRSSSARAYGFRMERLRRLKGEALAAALSGIAVEHLAEAAANAEGTTGADQQQQRRRREEGEEEAAEDAAFEAAAAAAQRQQAASGAVVARPRGARTAPPPPPARAAAAQRRSGPDQQQQKTQQQRPPSPAAPPAEPTEYARSRPRRDGAGQRGGAATLPGRSFARPTEACDLVPCCDFVGAPGSGAPLAQPFSVDVSSEALLVADAHAHLSSCEVIGLLGGHWDPRLRHLAVRSAVPCRRAPGSAAATSVELCAASEVEARATFSARGEACVGWYHSHPVFEPLPSLKDIDNQVNYQRLFEQREETRGGGGGGGGGAGEEQRDEDGGGEGSGGGGGRTFEPFVGFILSPFDPALAAPRTAVGAFVVRRAPPSSRKVAAPLPGGLAPFRVRYTVAAPSPSPSLPSTSSSSSSDAERALLSLARELRDDIGRTDLAAMWRPFTLRSPTGALEGGPMTRAQKLHAALVQRSGGGEKGRALAARVMREIERSWGVELGIGEEGAEEEEKGAAAADAP